MIDDPGTAMPEAPTDPLSPMQQAVIDSGATEVPNAIVSTYRTNEGTVFLASPADMARQGLMSSVRASRGRVQYHTTAEIDRLMKEE